MAVDKAEDRLKFRDAMDAIGLEFPRSRIAHTLSEAMEALEFVGLPTIIRPSFTMGGTGGGIAYNREEFVHIVGTGLDASPTTEVLIEESVLGWKEYEMEVVRDRADNAIIICGIENISSSSAPARSSSGRRASSIIRGRRRARRCAPRATASSWSTRTRRRS